MTKRTLWNVFKYCLAIGLLAYLVWSNWGVPQKEGSLACLWQRHVVEGQPIHYEFLALAATVYCGSVLLTFVRWWYLVRAQDLPFTLPNALRLGLVGFFFNTFLPGSIGGDLIKAYAIAKEQSRRTVAVATILIDRAVALWALVWFVVLLGAGFWAAGLFRGEVAAACKSIVLSAAGIIGVSLVICVVLLVLPAYRAERFAERLGRLPKVGHSAAEAWRAVWMYRCRPRSVLVAMGLALVGHVGFVLTFFFSARALFETDQIPKLYEHFLIVPIGMVIGAIPGPPGGLGVGELGYQKLYELLRMPGGNGLSASLVQRVIQWVLGFVGYLVYLRMRPALKPAVEQADAQLAVAEA